MKIARTTCVSDIVAERRITAPSGAWHTARLTPGEANRGRPHSVTRAIVLATLVVVVTPAPGADTPPAADPFAAVRVLEGTWKGEGHGFGQTSDVTHDWRLVLGGKFLRLETRSVVKGANGDGEVHEDVGYLSWDDDDSVLRFRQFLSEGYVNTFRVEAAAAPERGLRFEPESSESAGGMLARMTLTFQTDDRYEMVLELGRDGAAFKACQTMRLSRVERAPE